MDYALSPVLPAGLTYIAPTGMTMGGVISGVPTVRFAPTEYTLTVHDADADRTSEDAATLAFTLAVSGAALPAFAETGAVQRHTFPANTPVAIALPAATGGDGVLRYVFDPDPPAGLAFNEAARTISGTPTAPQAVTSYALTATDEDGDSDALVIRLTVLAANAPTVTAVTVDPPPHGDTFSVNSTIVPALAFSDPVAVSGSPRLALIIGTRTRQAVYWTTVGDQVLFRYRVQASDEDDDGLSIAANALTLNGGSIRAGSADADLALGGYAFANAANLKVNVRPAPVFAQTVAPQRYRKGTAVEVTLPAAAGGNGALDYALSPALPFRLTFDRATRTISGNPTVRFDRTEYTLTAHDADADRTAEDAGTLTFSIAVAGGVKPAFSAPINGQIYVVGHAVNTSLSAASGGDGRLTYALSPALPAGLTYTPPAEPSSGGAISGVPTAPMAADYALTATDSDGDVATETFALAVDADALPRFGDGAAAGAQRYSVGTAVDVTLPAAGGGNGSLTYALTPDLPAGLLFIQAPRRIYGTPTKIRAAATYALTATDGDAAMQTFSIAVEADERPAFAAATGPA